MNRFAFLDALVRSEPFRVFQILLGFLLMPAAFVIGLLSPAPLGIFVFGAGVALVLRNSRWARRRYMIYARRHPRVRKVVDIGLRRGKHRRARANAVSGASLPLTSPAPPTAPS